MWLAALGAANFIPGAHTFAAAATTRVGTSNAFYATAFLEHEDTVVKYIQSIAAMPEHRATSPEELRWAVESAAHGAPTSTAVAHSADVGAPDKVLVALPAVPVPVTPGSNPPFQKLKEACKTVVRRSGGSAI